MSESKGKFSSLSPGNNAKNVANYEEWLHSVATDSSTNQDYGNIALTGDIGIGKSSIVRTYEKNKNYKFVYITAGDLGYRFEKDEITGLPLLPRKKSECSNDENVEDEAVTSQNDDNGNQQEETEPPQDMTKDKSENSVELTDDEVEKLSEEIQQKLEKNLLEQLIALCSSKDIPKSHFQTVPENESAADKNIWQSIYPVFCGIAAFCGFKLIANNFIERDFVDFVDFEPIMWLVLIIFFSLSIAVAVSKLITHYKFTKITLNVGKEDSGGASAEIDIDEGENASLDTNLHEIIYLFEQLADKKSGKNEERPPVFVIEDVNRYPAEICFPILTKFKQINDMLNSRYRLNHSGYGKHYKFIYTLNDKIFDDSHGNRCVSDSDPYKFFDVIIPVIPKLSFANSLSILKSDFKDYNIDKEFFEDVSFYIYDFRKLRDIENEFVVYYEKFKNKLDNTQTEITDSSEKKKSNLTTTALLAFVMYKIFYKSEYYKLFRTDREGAPLSSLMRVYLIPNIETRNPDTLERILEKYFQNSLGCILDINEKVKEKYSGAIAIGNKNSNLSNAYMQKFDLSGRDLSGVFNNSKSLAINGDFGMGKSSLLMNSILKYVNMQGADLRDEILKKVNLQGADLQGANLKGANLQGANLKEAILRNVNLQDARLQEAKLQNANLQNANLKSANLKNTLYNNTNWKDARYDFKTCFPKHFNAKEHGMILDLRNEKLGNMDLGGKDLSFGWLNGANLENVKYDKTTIWTGARYDFDTILPKGLTPKEHGMILDLRNKNLNDMNLVGKDLSNALLMGTNLKNIIYDKTTIWTGAKYNKLTTELPDGLDPDKHGMEPV